MVRELCLKTGISISELARRVGQSPQNFNKKIIRDTLTAEEMIGIAKAVDVTYEESFVFSDGSRIDLGEKE